MVYDLTAIDIKGVDLEADPKGTSVPTGPAKYSPRASMSAIVCGPDYQKLTSSGNAASAYSHYSGRP